MWIANADPISTRSIERVARDAKFVITTEPPATDPALRIVIVSSLGLSEQPSAVLPWRTSYPACFIIGYLDAPDQNAWLSAERAGFDVVCSRGGLGPALRKVLNDDSATSADRAIAVCDSSAVAGRLGHLMDVELPKLGEVSLWRIAGRIVCTGKCPHQKVSLARGEIEETIVTCPAHGSRFDLLTGERVRGPSDFDLSCYGAYELNGRVWVLPK